MAFQVEMDLSGAPFYDISGGNGSGTYYISDQAGSSDSSKYYQPLLKSLPFLQEGDYDDGWLKPSYGHMLLHADIENLDHPFNGKNLSTLVDSPMSSIPCSFYWNGNSVGKVSAVLNGMTDVEMSFQLEAPVNRFNLLRLYLAETTSTAEFLEITDNGSGKCRILFANLHPYSIGEDVFFVGMDVVASEFNSDGTSNTLFQVIDIPTDYTVDFDFNFSDVAFRNPTTQNQTVVSGVTITSDTTVDNVVTLDSPITVHSGVIYTITGTLSVSTTGKRLPEAMTVSSGHTMTISSDSLVSVSGGDGAYYDSGSASASDSQLPYAFGTITMEAPAIILNNSKTQVGNPNLMVSLTVDGVNKSAGVEDDGQSESISTGASTDFTTVTGQNFPTLELSSGSVVGEVSLTGTTGFVDRTNGDSTASDFFTAIGNTLGYGVNSSTYAPNSDSVNAQLSIFETRQQRTIDFASEVTKGINYQFYIDENEKVIHVIDRANVPSSASLTLYEQDIGEIRMSLPRPISGIKTDRSYNVALGDGSTANAYQLFNVKRFVRISVLNTGNDLSYRTFAPSIQTATFALNNIRNILVRPKVELTIAGINTDIKHGQKIQFYSETLRLSGYLIVRKRGWDFESEKTSFSGDAVVDYYTQSAS